MSATKKLIEAIEILMDWSDSDSIYDCQNDFALRLERDSAMERVRTLLEEVKKEISF